MSRNDNGQFSLITREIGRSRCGILDQEARTKDELTHATPQEISKIMSKPTCSVEDAARVLNIGRAQAYRAANSGEIRAVRIGGRLLVSTSALRELLDGVPAA